MTTLPYPVISGIAPNQATGLPSQIIRALEATGAIPAPDESSNLSATHSPSGKGSVQTIPGIHNLMPTPQGIMNVLQNFASNFMPGTGNLPGGLGSSIIGMASGGWLRNRFTRDQIAEIVRLRSDGKSLRSIGNQFNVPGTSIMNLLKREGVHVPGQFSARHSEDVVQRYNIGETIPAIAESYGVTIPTVRGILQGANVYRGRQGGYNTRLVRNLDDISTRRANNETYGAIAEDYGTDARTIRNILRRYNRDTVREPQFLNPEPPITPAALTPPPTLLPSLPPLKIPGRVSDRSMVDEAVTIRNFENTLRNLNLSASEVARQLNQRFKLGTTADEVQNQGGWWYNPIQGSE